MDASDRNRQLGPRTTAWRAEDIRTLIEHGSHRRAASGARLRPLRSCASDEKERKESQAKVLINIAAAAELFHAPDGTGPQHEVHVRVAGHEDRLYLDLADEDWRVIEIDKEGWRPRHDAPVRFRRAPGMLALPMPESGGSVSALRTFLNTSTTENFVLASAWLLAAFRDRGPYPVLALSGEQGSAKSTFAAILRALVDPNTAPLRALPREDRDLFIAATNAHFLAFDNVSHLPPWLADTLCRIATGGGFAVRQLYTDGDEMLFDAERPVILNGIEDIVERPDLADRAVFLTLEPIPEDRRRPEQELWAEFEQERPRILGALLDAVASGSRVLPDVKLDRLPRMADFAILGDGLRARAVARRNLRRGLLREPRRGCRGGDRGRSRGQCTARTDGSEGSVERNGHKAPLRALRDCR
jgi:hypothetical protein